jgi:hypothetical protein
MPSQQAVLKQDSVLSHETVVGQPQHPSGLICLAGRTLAIPGFFFIGDFAAGLDRKFIPLLTPGF